MGTRDRKKKDREKEKRVITKRGEITLGGGGDGQFKKKNMGGIVNASFVLLKG